MDTIAIDPATRRRICMACYAMLRSDAALEQVIAVMKHVRGGEIVTRLHGESIQDFTVRAKNVARDHALTWLGNNVSLR
jgi:hypothetical protein